MHVLIIGGYGEFGGRLAELLLRDGLAVSIAGRSKSKAEAFCSRIGGQAVEIDVDRNLEHIAELNVDVVIDAAGPFQQHVGQADPYRVAKAALNCGAHYFDLSDDGDFARGIACLDDEARRAQLCVLSGASSTPALSGAVVTAIAKDFQTVEKIETSILPGSHAPIGRSVMLAILEQVGNPVRFWSNGEWAEYNGWSEPKEISIGDKLTRRANLINAADATLFPDAFQAQTVLFRAGLAMPLMHNSLQYLGTLRRWRLLPPLTLFIRPLSFLAKWLSPLASDYGGMLVRVTGQKHVDEDSDRNSWCEATWSLLAEPKQGPYVPAIAVRTLLRRLEKIEPGARACIDEAPLSEFEDAMHDIGTHTNQEQLQKNGLFKQVLLTDWQNIPEPIRRSHGFTSMIKLSGEASVERGHSLIAKFIAGLFRFPKQTENTKVAVLKKRYGENEIWLRQFGLQAFKSTLSPIGKLSDTQTPVESPAKVSEQFGLLKFVLQLPVNASGLHYRVESGSCLGIPIPTFLLPVSETSEFEKDGRMHFSVKLLAPLGAGLIVHYKGWLEAH